MFCRRGCPASPTGQRSAAPGSYMPRHNFVTCASGGASLLSPCGGRVGAVFAIEASRLARDGRDWHTLIECCGWVGTILVDEDGICNPHPSASFVRNVHAS